MAKVRLPDGSIIEAADGTTVREFAERIGAGLAKAAIGGRVNDQLVDVNTPISGEVELTIITGKNDEGLEIMRHSCAHIMAEAICGIWPGVRLVYGPTVTDGFYYDIDLEQPIKPEDFERIEKRMAEIVKADKPFKRIELSRGDALK